MKAGNAMTRAFCAFEIPREAKSAIARFCDSVRARPVGRDLKWVRSEILHLTVRFFGDLDAESLDRAGTAVAGLDGAWDAPGLALGPVGAFPSARRPSVYWIGLADPDGALARLAAETDAAIRGQGFGRADKPFVPHLTIARVGRDRSGPPLEELTSGLTQPAGQLTVTSITLFKSDLRPGGPVYTPLVVARPRAARSGGGAD